MVDFRRYHPVAGGPRIGNLADWFRTGTDNVSVYWYGLLCFSVASSLNSSYCYILHNDTTVFTWSGSLTTSEDQDLVERLLDQIKMHGNSYQRKLAIVKTGVTRPVEVR
ncbi:hypothetical protein GW17_00024113 [Ensete ventricosum]|nr:hypothetical protein GW17_00024113 [Ensete ventricosum]